jgi:hypothetical protein
MKDMILEFSLKENPAAAGMRKKVTLTVPDEIIEMAAGMYFTICLRSHFRRAKGEYGKVRILGHDCTYVEDY